MPAWHKLFYGLAAESIRPLTILSTTVAVASIIYFSLIRLDRHQMYTLPSSFNTTETTLSDEE
jgi:hypothetical protein